MMYSGKSNGDCLWSVSPDKAGLTRKAGDTVIPDPGAGVYFEDKGIGEEG